MTILNFTERTEPEVAWRENRERLNLAARQLAKRVADRAMAEMHKRFLAELNAGKVLEFHPTVEDLKRLMAEAAKRELGSGD